MSEVGDGAKAAAREWVDKKWARTVSAKDEPALAEIIQRLAVEPERADRCTECGAETRECDLSEGQLRACNGCDLRDRLATAERDLEGERDVRTAVEKTRDEYERDLGFARQQIGAFDATRDVSRDAIGRADNRAKDAEREREDVKERLCIVTDELIGLRNENRITLGHAIEVILADAIDREGDNFTAHRVLFDDGQYSFIAQKQDGVTPAVVIEQLRKQVAKLERALVG